MTDIIILAKEPIAVPHLPKIIKGVKKEERAEVQNKILDYSKKASKLSDAECSKLIDELRDLSLPGITSDIIVSITNVLPETLTELRTVLAGKSNISPESFKKIQEVLAKYVK